MNIFYNKLYLKLMKINKFDIILGNLGMFDFNNMYLKGIM
jgi:hypothetical protein